MRKPHRKPQPTVQRGILHTCGCDEWYIRTDGTPRCAPCQRAITARSQHRRRGAPVPKRRKIHPRVLRAIRSTAGGRKRKGGRKRTYIEQPREAVPVDREALNRAWERENGFCRASGVRMLDDPKDKNHPHYAEPDRIRPELGYIEGNVQWICKHLNQYKSNIPPEILVILGRNAEQNLMDEQERRMA